MWFGLAWWRQSWVFTTLNRTGSSLHHMKNISKYANICKHLKNLPQSCCKLAGLIRDRRRPLTCHGFLSVPVTALKGTNEKEVLKSSFISGQLVPWIYIVFCFLSSEFVICQSFSKQYIQLHTDTLQFIPTSSVCTNTHLRTHECLNESSTCTQSQRANSLFKSSTRSTWKCNSSRGSITLIHHQPRVSTSYEDIKFKRLFGKPVLGHVGRPYINLCSVWHFCLTVRTRLLCCFLGQDFCFCETFSPLNMWIFLQTLLIIVCKFDNYV